MPGKFCSNCGKTAGKGNSRSHSNIATKRRFDANLQVKKVNGKRENMCASCIRTLAKA